MTRLTLTGTRCDPRANVGARKKPLAVQRLGEIVPHILRVESLKCFRIIEVQTADAVRLYGPEAVWRNVGKRLLEEGVEVELVTVMMTVAGQITEEPDYVSANVPTSDR